MCDVIPMKQFALACLFIIVSNSAMAQFTWVNKNPFPDSARVNAGCFTINGKGYIVGGLVSVSPPTYTSQVWEYDPATDGWTRKTNFPYPSFLGGECSVVNGKAYKIGANTTSGYYYSNTYEYDPTNDSWTQKASFPEDGIGGNFQFVLNNKIYVGASARNSNVHGVVTSYAYDTDSDTWSRIADFPGSPRITVTGFAIDSFGYAGLGGDGNNNFFSDFFKYNPYNNTWSKIDSYPGKARAAIPVQFVLNGKAYVGAGSSTISNTTAAYQLGDLYEYDPAQNKWTPVPGIPGPPRDHPAVLSFDNGTYVVGGYNSDGNLLFNDASEFTLCGNVIDTVNITISDTNQVRINDTLFVQLYDTTRISVTETDTLIIKANLTGVSSLNNSITVKVFPNPAKNHLQVFIDNGGYASMNGYFIKITNLLSQNVFVSPVNQQQFDIDIGAWGGAGTYALYIVDPQLNVVATKMIIIQ